MRFMANENFPAASVHLLRQAGHDVLYVAEDFPSVEDEAVLHAACSQQRILITFDRDYGELIFKHRLPAPSGVPYLRFDPLTPTEPAEQPLALLQNNEVKVDQFFTVLTRNRIRQRRLP